MPFHDFLNQALTISISHCDKTVNVIQIKKKEPTEANYSILLLKIKAVQLNKTEHLFNVEQRSYT